MTEHEAYLMEIINNNNKRIYKLEQETDELKRRLQDTQRQNDALNKRLFTFENIKQKIPMLLFILASIPGMLLWLFSSTLILGREVRIFPSGNLPLTSHLIIARTKQVN